MSVEDSKIVDAISADPKGNIVLTISDHLEWDENSEHLLVLQNKINDYLSFIESGQIYSDYTHAKGKNFIINIYAKFLPNETAERFLRCTRETIQAAGYDLTLSFVERQ
jgi:hypothetical protein